MIRWRVTASGGRRWFINWRPLLREIVLVMTVALLLHLATPRFVVDGRSMQPNLEDSQFLVGTPLEYLFHPPERGDVVVVAPVATGEPSLVKRIIGIPGDRIEFLGGQLYLNDILQHETFIKEACTPVRCRDQVWQLGPEEYFVMGDNRNVSRDSRHYGPIPREKIRAKALLRYWPLSEWSWIESQTGEPDEG